MTENNKRKEIIEELSKIDVSKFVEVKGERTQLSYLSWANCWAIIIEHFPEATYKIKEFPEYLFNKTNGMWEATGREVDYRQTVAGTEVQVEVDIDGEKFEQRLFVMDNRNQPVQNPNIAQINKTQMRCLVKAAAMAGLGLNLYQGEDLPTSETVSRRGISKEQITQREKIDSKKAAFNELMKQVAKMQKITIDELREIVKKRVEKEFGITTDLCETYSSGIEVLKKIIKETADKKA